jgi:hypothetical protein
MKKIVYLFILIAVVYPSFSKWELLPGPGDNNNISHLFISNGDIYVTIGGCIFKTENMGKKWMLLNSNSNILFNNIESLF